MCEFIRDHEDAAPSPLTPESLETETALQLNDGADAPLVAATRIPLHPFRFGLTAVYGQKTRTIGTLVLVRSVSEGPFTVSDRNALLVSLQAASDDLWRLSIFEGEAAAFTHVSQRSFPAQFVLNERLEVEWRWCPPETDESDVLSTMLASDDRLPPAIDRAVRGVVSRWTDDPATWRETVVLPLPFVVARIFPLTGGGHRPHVAVLIERYQARNALRLAIKKFGLSRREVEVLSLLLQGRGSTEIAHGLGIAESTVNDHIKRLLTKVQARNRVDLAAKALGWRAL
jgi:DNA-binding CsgD family transcriptional regulator